MAYKFHSEDNGNCRVYYKGEGGRLYCYQDDGSWGRADWKFYTCTRDGEPSYEVKPSAPVPAPVNPETSTGRALLAYLMPPRTKYTAHFSARKHGAIGQWYSVRVEFEGEPGLDRDTGFKPAWDALERSGHECHHLVSLAQVLS